MKTLLVPLLAVALLGARHAETPFQAAERPITDAACDYAFQHDTADNAADQCLAAADEWARIAARHNRERDAYHYELMEAMTRVETSIAMHTAKLSGAFGQMEIAVSIISGVCRTDFPESELAVCNGVARVAAKEYPKVWKLDKAR